MKYKYGLKNFNIFLLSFLSSTKLYFPVYEKILGEFTGSVGKMLSRPDVSIFVLESAWSTRCENYVKKKKLLCGIRSTHIYQMGRETPTVVQPSNPPYDSKNHPTPLELAKHSLYQRLFIALRRHSIVEEC